MSLVVRGFRALLPQEKVLSKWPLVGLVGHHILAAVGERQLPRL
jgi:hypothetical protein